MEQYTEPSNTIIKFIKETKEGKYAIIEKNAIEIPRNTLSRDEYVFDEKEEMSVFFSMSN